MHNWQHNIVRYVLLIYMSVIWSGCQTRHNPDPALSNYRIHSDQELDSVRKQLKKNPDDLTCNLKMMVYFTERRMPEELEAFATPVFERARKSGNQPLMLYAGAYLAQMLLLEKDSGEAGYYLKAIQPAVGSTRDRFLQAMIHNISAIYAMRKEANYPEALAHYKAAYDIVATRKDTLNMSTLLCNIANIYYYRNDTAGYPYALKAYRLVQNGTSHYARFLTTTQLALMYELKGEYGEALRLTGEARNFEDGRPQNRLQILTLQGNILTDQADYVRAEACFREAMELLESQKGLTWETTMIGYGRMLQQTGRYREALNVFQKTLHFNGQECDIHHKHQIYRHLSETADRMGLEKEALAYYKAYQAETNRIFNLPKEKRFQELISENVRISLQNQIQQQQLELLKSQRKTWLISIVLTLVSLSLAVAIAVYRKQNRLYRRMVEYHQAMLHAEQAEAAEPRKPDTREQELWDRLNWLMNEEHIYREKDISLEKIAERLGTNRTYASQVINRFSGENFNNFIHKRRIRDAAIRLADPTASLKEIAYGLGYNSLASFYRAFQKEIGCPPSKYREIIKNMEGEESKS